MHFPSTRYASVFTTVHPAGQLSTPLIMVEFVPSADGHRKVPLAATLGTHASRFQLELVVVKYAVISFMAEQAANMLTNSFVIDVTPPTLIGLSAFPIAGLFSRLEQRQNIS